MTASAFRLTAALVVLAGWVATVHAQPVGDTRPTQTPGGNRNPTGYGVRVPVPVPSPTPAPAPRPPEPIRPSAFKPSSVHVQPRTGGRWLWGLGAGVVAVIGGILSAIFGRKEKDPPSPPTGGTPA